MMNTIKFKINISTYFLIFLLLFSGYKTILLYIILIFLVHELGHIFFCFLFKVNIKKIEILPFGGLITIEKNINYPFIKDLLISSGGIIFQLFLFLIDNGVIYKYNLLIIIMNIIPVIPLDGSKILFVVISNYISFYKSLIINVIISFFSIGVIIFYGFIYKSLNVCYVSFLIYYLVIEITSISKTFHKFLLERYISNFIFKKVKYYSKFNFKYLVKNIKGYYYVNSWKEEQYFLRKKFDISTYF